MKCRAFVLALLLALCILGLSACGEKSTPAAAAPSKKESPKHATKQAEHGTPGDRQQGPGIEMEEVEIKAAGIRTEKVDWSASGAELAVTGVIQPNLDRLAQVAPRVPGRVLRVQASLGDRVAGGQALAVLDSLEVGEARAVLAQSEAELKVAEAAFHRASSLRAENVVPEKEFLRAQGDLEKTRAATATAREKLRMLGVGAAAGGAASHFVVAAPFAGTVTEKSAVPGALADPAKPLFTVADLSVVWVEVDVFEKDLPRLVRGTAASVVVAAWPGAPTTGRLTYVASVMDRETRTVKARVEVPNADGRLRPGMFANVAIAVPAESAAKSLLVPEDAVVLIDRKTSVFVRSEHGFERRTVAPGQRRAGRVELKDGVVAGDEVVVAGAYELKARLQKAHLGEGHAH